MSNAALGHNRPPSPIEYSEVAREDLGVFLADNPVIHTKEQAVQGALFLERCRKTLQDLDDARRRVVDPLNVQVKAVNEEYRAARVPLEKTLDVLKFRLTDYAGQLEAERISIAEEARRLAEAAEMEARRAEEAEKQAKEGATFGEITDVAAAVVEADQAFSTFQRAERAADIAEREVHVRLQSQLGGRAVSLRNKETLVLDNVSAAIGCMGVTDGIRDAVLSAARAYRKLQGKLPPGVRAEHTREI